MEMKGGFAMNNRLIFALVAVALVIVAGYMYYNTGATVSAQGTAQVKAMPDEVSVYINVQARNASAELAQTQQNEISDDLITELVKLGFERKEIQTLSMSVYEDFDWSSGNRVSKGYLAVHQISVKTNDFDKTGAIVDKAIESGALVSGINFELSQEKQNEYKQEALKKAGEDAKAKAEATAEGLGKNLGRLVSVESQDFYYYPRALYSGAGMDMVAENAQAKAAASSISPSEMDVSATLQVKYKLGFL